jgi:hypothetical protein
MILLSKLKIQLESLKKELLESTSDNKPKLMVHILAMENLLEQLEKKNAYADILEYGYGP